MEDEFPFGFRPIFRCKLLVLGRVTNFSAIFSSTAQAVFFTKNLQTAPSSSVDCYIATLVTGKARTILRGSWLIRVMYLNQKMCIYIYIFIDKYIYISYIIYIYISKYISIYIYTSLYVYTYVPQQKTPK